MQNWRDFMYGVMKDLGRVSNLTEDIYPLVESRSNDLGANWKARVRATLEENSSDTDSWLGNYDLFRNVSKGEGNWILRELDPIKLNERLSLWKQLCDNSDDDVTPSYIRELGIYKGQTGICRDDMGICLSILNTGRHYPDEIADDVILYNYPNTTKRSKTFDINEINSVKECQKMNLPIFVILPGNNSSLRRVKLGWVDGYDDDCEQFLIKFSEEQINTNMKTKESDFIPIIPRDKKKREMDVRTNNQAKFRFDSFKRYGSKCAFCEIMDKRLLDAAHIIPVDKNGSDDPRNGIILCKNHHAAFDKELVNIDSETLSIKSNISLINITEKFINTKTGELPHQDALKYRFDEKK